MKASIIGSYHSNFGKLKEKNIYDLIIEAGKGAIQDAGINIDKIGGIWVANYASNKFNNQNHIAPIALEIDDELRYTPAVHVENACASGSAAIREAKNAILSGEIDYALVIGAEKMTSSNMQQTTKILSEASHWIKEGSQGVTFPGLFAEYAKGYKKEYGFSSLKLEELLARVSAKNHKNALGNSLAQLPLDINYRDILNKSDNKNPVISSPLKLMDCSLVSDGSAAIILTSSKNASKLNKSFVQIESLVQKTDFLSLDKRKKFKLEAGEKCIKEALNKASCEIEDIDFAEVHDCFTIAEVLIYEAMGIAGPGEAFKLLESGYTDIDGELPVNASGGLKAKGHPVGATGVSMAVLAYRQLINKSIGHQVNNAKIGLTFNIGGSASSNYAIVYKKS